MALDIDFLMADYQSYVRSFEHEQFLMRASTTDEPDTFGDWLCGQPDEYIAAHTLDADE